MKIISLPSYLCLLATLLFMPGSCLIPLPSSCHCILAIAFWGLWKAAAIFRGGTRWWNWWWGMVRVCGLHWDQQSLLPGLRQFKWCSHSPLSLIPWQMSGLMALIPVPRPLLSLRGASPPLHSSAFLSVNILWKIWFVFRFFCQTAHHLFFFFPST